MIDNSEEDFDEEVMMDAMEAGADDFEADAMYLKSTPCRTISTMCRMYGTTGKSDFK